MRQPAWSSRKTRSSVARSANCRRQKSDSLLRRRRYEPRNSRRRKMGISVRLRLRQSNGWRNARQSVPPIRGMWIPSRNRAASWLSSQRRGRVYLRRVNSNVSRFVDGLRRRWGIAENHGPVPPRRARGGTNYNPIGKLGGVRPADLRSEFGAGLIKRKDDC